MPRRNASQANPMGINGYGPRPSQGPGPYVLIMPNIHAQAGTRHPSQAGRDGRSAAHPASRHLSRQPSQHLPQGSVRHGSGPQPSRHSSHVGYPAGTFTTAPHRPFQGQRVPTQAHLPPRQQIYIDPLTGRPGYRPSTQLALMRPSVPVAVQCNSHGPPHSHIIGDGLQDIGGSSRPGVGPVQQYNGRHSRHGRQGSRSVHEFIHYSETRYTYREE
jgi:hypothetical protein